MIPHLEVGSNMGGLMTYLAGRGRANEHEDQHVVAASERLAADHVGHPLTHTEALEISHKLEQSKRLSGARPTGGHVYHVSLSIPAEDGRMTDERWAEISRSYLEKTGYLGQPGKADAPYVVLRHGVSTAGNDHVHIAASRVREDGEVVPNWQSKRAAQRACRELEVEHDLPTKLMDGAGARADKPGELEAAKARGRDVADWQVAARAVRAAQVQSNTEADFVAHLRATDGILVRPRLLENGQAVGYAVAVKPPEGKAPVFYAGSKLGNDLGLNVVRSGMAVVDDEKAREQWAGAKAGRELVVQSEPVTRDELKRAVAEVKALRKSLTHTQDPETLRRAAVFTSGFWAAYGKADEKNRAELNGSADMLGKLAQTSKANYRADVAPGHPAPTAGRVAGMIHTVPEKHRAELFAEVSKTSNVVVAKAIERGDGVKGLAAQRTVGPQLARAWVNVGQAFQRDMSSALGADMMMEPEQSRGKSSGFGLG